MLSNVIVDITISCRSFEFSQLYVQTSASLTKISGLAVAAFDLLNFSLSVAWLVSVLNVCQQLSQSGDRFVSNTDVVGSAQ